MTNIGRLIWTTQIGEIPKGYVIHHKDNNYNNNHIENLSCMPWEVHSHIHNINSNRNFDVSQNLNHFPQMKYCLLCGTIFLAKRGTKKYCHRRCRDKDHKIRKRLNLNEPY